MDKKLRTQLIACIFGTVPFLAGLDQDVLAAGTDIATSPLANRQSSDLKANIMLILDDSGSMTYDAMPDFSNNYNRYGPGRRSYLCNTIYYNPTPTVASSAITPYLVPRDDLGFVLNSTDPASFTNAYDNGFWSYDQMGVTAGTADRINLSVTQHHGASFPLDDLAQPAFYWNYIGTAAVSPSSDLCSTPTADTSNFASATGICAESAAAVTGAFTAITDAVPTDAACATANISTPILVWKKTLVTATSSLATVTDPVTLVVSGYDERERFANWYSYYRNRLQVMKSALGRAFLPLIGKKKYRVGFITINPQQLRAGAYQASVYGYNAAAPYDSKFLGVENFDTLSATHVNQWFNILYAQQPNGQTPLREGLSRVGRYYAGKNDGPNAGMIPSSAYDPMQYACQQNFSILTTDGYWDSPGGSIGGFKLDYAVAMDNQDGDITEVSVPLDKDGLSQGLAIGARPIYDGTISQSGTLWDATNRYSLVNCTWYYKSTNQALKYQTVVNRTWAQTNKTDSQVAQSTAQNRQTTYRSQKTDKQLKQSTSQSQEQTWQIRKTTDQIVQTTVQNNASLWAVTRAKYQDYQTSDVLKTTAWQLETRSRQATKTTTQYKQTTSITQKTQVVYSAATNSPRQTQSQNLETSVQAKQSTDQWIQCNGAGFDCQPAQSCTAVPEVVTCQHNVTTNIPVQTCSTQTAASGNSWITITCSNPASTNYSNVGVQTCTPQTASNGNNWVGKTCSTNNFTNQPVQSCTAQTGAAGNNWLTISCPAAVTTGPTNVDPASSCAIGGANGTCAVAGTSPNWITTTYTKTTTVLGVSTCAGPQTASIGNSWVAYTCFNWSSAANVPVPSACVATAVGGQARASFTGANATVLGYTSASPVWENTTCGATPVSTIKVRDDGAASCVAQAAAAGNSYTGIACGWVAAYTSYVAHTGAASCNAGAVGSVADNYGSNISGNGSGAGDWLHVQCSKTDKTPATAPSTCATQIAAQANNWLNRTCTTGNAYNNSNQIVGPCPSVTSSVNGYDTGAKTAFTGPGGYSGPTGKVYVTTSCNNNVVTEASNPRSPASCGCNSEPYDMVTPRSCTVNASAGNSWTRTVCTRSFVGSTPIATCVAGVAGSSPWYETTCPSATTTGPTPQASWAACGCTPAGAATTCQVLPTAGNNYTTTTCTDTQTGPTAVQTCVGIGTIAADPTAGAPSVTNLATAGNAYTSTTCTYNQTSALAYVSDCSAPPYTNPITPNVAAVPTYRAGNATWYSCSRVTTGDAYGGSTGIVWKDPNNAGTSCGCAPGSVNGACNPAGSGTAGINYLKTQCTDLTAWSTPSSCAGNVVTAVGGNNWKESTCSNAIYNGINDIAVQTCPSTSGAGALPAAGSYATNFGAGVYGGTNGAGSSAYYYTTNCSTLTNANGVVDPVTCGCTVGADNGSCNVAATAGNAWTTTTCNKTSVLTPVQSGTCTLVAAASGNGWTQTTCPVTTNGPSAVDPASCGCAPGTNATCSVAGANPSTVPGVPIWANTTCQDVTSGPTPVGTCTNVAVPVAGNSPPWSTTACDTTSSPLNTSNVPVQTCTTVSGAAAVGPDFLTTTCAPVATGKKIQYETSTQQSAVAYSGGVIVSSIPAAWSGYSAAADFGQCLGTDAASWPTAPADGQPGAGTPTTPSLASINGSCTSWPCLDLTTGLIGGSSNSLADVAQYYYKTDLRPVGTTGFNGLDVSLNIISSKATDITEDDMAKWQHMTTFTMGLGVSGLVPFTGDYRDKPVGAFSTVATIDPVTGLERPIGTPLEPFQQIRCQGANNLMLADQWLCENWPLPAPGTPSQVDDLWHAAVNGRGIYFNAADPDAVYNGLQLALKAIDAQSGAGTGATTSTQDPVPGNDLTFRAGFRTVDWTGDIRAQQYYTGTNLALEGTTLAGNVWSAQSKLDGQVRSLCDYRNIYLMRQGATNNMVPFTWNTSACDGAGVPTGSPSTGIDASEQAYFTSASPSYVAPFPMNSWSQFIDMTSGATGQRTLGQGANLVNFLRGQRGLEDFVPGSATKLFRKRAHVLGDIVTSQPRYVTRPNAQFTDTGYALFKAKPGIVDRPSMLYVGANDGMLHAFKVGANVSDTEGGTEAWAIIPSAVLPDLYRLADTEYSASHSYYVDGSPTAGDVYNKYAMVSTPGDCLVAGAPTLARDCWRTILVGGLGSGGRGYYAIDITDPASPKTLWEFKWSDTCYAQITPATHSADCHIGLTFGAPLITKLVDGTWVVLVTSGINNVNSPAKAGDGQGYLYVLDAITGKILKKLSTGVGSADTGTSPLSGTLTLNGSAAVTGAGTAFTTELVAGQTIIVNGESRIVQTIPDSTHLTVSAPFASSGAFAGTAASSGASSFTYINAYVENYIQDNTTERVYGGDMLGNVWRIELKGVADSTDAVVKLATLTDPSGIPQPITTTPQLMNVGAAKTRMVYVGTGRYLGESDLSNTQVQTVYGLAENLNITTTSPSYLTNGSTVLPTIGLTLREQLNQVVLSPTVADPTVRQATTPACSAAAAAAGIACAGWYADLPDPGERVNLDMRLILGTLLVTTNVTNLTACDSGGNSWLNVFDAGTGGQVPSSPYGAGKYMPGAISVGISLIRGQSGRILSVITRSDDTQAVTEVQAQQGAPLGRRTGWRDLLN